MKALKEDDIRDKDQEEASAIDDGTRSTHSLKVAKTGSTSSEDTDIEEGVNQENDNTTQEADESSEDEMDFIVESHAEGTSTFVRVPIPGKSFSSTCKPRLVPNGCAICLCEFEAGERVTWSATDKDPHVFHEECMMNYLLCVGSKASRRRRRHQEDQDPDQDPVEAATDFPMLCPCCRQQFVSKGPLSVEVTPQSSGEEVIGNSDGLEELSV